MISVNDNIYFLIISTFLAEPFVAKRKTKAKQKKKKGSTWEVDSIYFSFFKLFIKLKSKLDLAQKFLHVFKVVGSNKKRKLRFGKK